MPARTKLRPTAAGTVSDSLPDAPLPREQDLVLRRTLRVRETPQRQREALPRTRNAKHGVLQRENEIGQNTRPCPLAPRASFT